MKKKNQELESLLKLAKSVNEKLQQEIKMRGEHIQVKRRELILQGKFDVFESKNVILRDKVKNLEKKREEFYRIYDDYVMYFHMFMAKEMNTTWAMLSKKLEDELMSYIEDPRTIETYTKLEAKLNKWVFTSFE